MINVFLFKKSDPCLTVSILTCVFLSAIILSRRFMPLRMPSKSHTSLMIDYISAAADIIDFVEFVNEETIFNDNQVNPVYSI